MKRRLDSTRRIPCTAHPINAAGVLAARELPPSGGQLPERLQQLEYSASNIGWGYCDSVREQVQMLEAALGAEEETAPQTTPPNEQP